MKIVRSNDEQIVSAHGRYLYGQNNNLYYNQQTGTDCAYDVDVDFSYSDKEFMNELAKDRAYGTSNIRPISKDMNSFSQRMYKDAIEEASRVKTMGYFNKFPELKPTNTIHSTPHNNIANINNKEKSPVHKEHLSNIIFSIDNKEPKQNMSFSSSVNTDDSNKNSFVSIQDQNNLATTSDINIIGASPNKYNDLINQAQNNLKQEIATQIVEENRQKLREDFKANINNIPYKKTKEFVPTEVAETNQQLQVRDYKKSKDDDTENPRMSFFKWLISIPFLIIPILGFLVSGIISITVPKDKSFKIFTRFCLVTHMLASIAATYLYYIGKLDLSMITKYFNI